MSADVPRRLGRGLEALISTAKRERGGSAPEQGREERPTTELQTVHIADISANHFQPRRVFPEAELAELESSIRSNGLLQPITVRPRTGGTWELVAGERRLRAVTRLGWTEIPAIVRDFDDRAMLTLALVENLQRADLNALEEAEGYQRLIEQFGLTQQQVADAVGKDRTTITNLIRVLSLPVSVRKMVEQGQISAGHARALLAVKDERRQVEIANEIIARQLSVRDVESRARQLSPAGRSPGMKGSKGASSSPTRDPELRRIEDQLRKRLQTDVSIERQGTDQGAVRISFFGADDLERILDLILDKNRSDFD